MKLLVCVSKTPETTTKIQLTSDGSEIDRSGVQYIMNPYDEWYALVRALELKEAAGGTVTLLNVGPAENDPIIRKGLAIGADDAVRIDVSDEKDSLYTARQIAEYSRDQAYDLILFGKETISYNGSEVGAMVAEFLDWPYIGDATHLEVEGTAATVTRDIEGGEEVIEVQTPLALSAAKGMAEQRIPNMRGIMMAKRKPLEVVPPVDFPDTTRIAGYHKPAEKGSVKLIDPENMDELVRLLHEEAKVI
ncbi:electron transfer flavoprotein beta subunit [Lewinella marina]|uniref:Electron transfer flavoprotein subunit alpha n=1 Tax=Neolewinella marina TaxID=438751 RepID=A0A2G0CGG3_9BACT|nr:electron transfer flavoprotein subunit beta/FixA family protein [Neolewinella marina]NJB86539.1 electron transfer flavoprotein beta subunit [Neolewinella marina]PHK99007.1 electron transfer flavoprotein subunit alpha [Neolewinella marina]